MGVCKFVLLLSLFFLGYCAYTASGQNYCNVQRSYQVRVARYGYRWCWRWRPYWYYRYWCYWNWYNRCRYRYYVTETRYYTQRRCCTGYTGYRCLTPTCNPPCQNGGVCSGVNDCYCRTGSGGNNCATRYCSYATDCYPGTCNSRSNSCSCTSGFEGSSCTQIREGGEFSSCEVTLNHGQTEVYESDCLAPNENTYTNLNNLQDMRLEWQVGWEPSPDTPVAPSYIVASRPGIIASHSTVKLYNAANSTVYSSQQPCNTHNVSAVNPYLLVQCRNVFHSITHQGGEAQHGDKLVIQFHSSTGGYKTFKREDTQAVNNRSFTGESSESETIEIMFDLKKPIHCSEAGAENCDQTDQPALSVYPDNVQGNEVELQMFGWDDPDSGIKEIKFTMYRMEHNRATDKLEQSDTAIGEPIIWDPEDDPPIMNVDEPGVYSVCMEVSDHAGNVATARTLFIADQENHVELDDATSIRVDRKPITDEDVFWIGASGNFDVQWARLFVNNHHMENHMLHEATAEVAIHLDDNLVQFGNRTLQAVNHYNGIRRFELLWRKLPLSDVTTEDTENLVEVFTLTGMDRQDGDAYEITIQGYDTMEYMKSHSIMVHVDSSAPVIIGTQTRHMEYNVQSERSDMPYSSRLRIPVMDEHSGISEISFRMYDLTSNTYIAPTVNAPIVQTAPMYPSSMQSECTATGQCYCPERFPRCFDQLQSLWLNNCWFKDMDLATLNLRLEYDITNSAGEQLRNQVFPVGQLQNLEGIDEYPTPVDVATSRNRDGGVDVIWFLPRACVLADRMYLIVYEGDDSTRHLIQQAANSTRYTLQDLQEGAEFDISFQVYYEDDREIESQRISFRVDSADSKDSNSGALGAGAIVGIVIVIIVICLLVAALIVMFVRYRKHQHPVPLVLREARETVSDRLTKRFSRHPGFTDAHYDNNAHNTEAGIASEKDVTLNVAYADDDDMYIYGNMDTDPNATWKHSSDSLTITGGLPGAKGRFADLKLGKLRVPEGTKTVVVKMNKSGASEDDKLLMQAKMNFLATSLPPHDLVVGLIGGVPPPAGPMLLLEYCDSGTLLAWLQKLVKVTGDVEEQMVTFTMHIATALDFLHDKGVLHRRLGARNVLLHRTAATTQLVAKLTGFGPLKGEGDDSGASKKDDRVPIKWMAPEQLNKPAGQKRVYSKKTDMWSYGITLWEIFSKGGRPYSDKTVQEMKRDVRAGHRLKKPADCPAYMYTEIMTPCWEGDADLRPACDVIAAKLNRDYGCNGGDIYDYDSRQSKAMYGNAMSVD